MSFHARDSFHWKYEQTSLAGVPERARRANQEQCAEHVRGDAPPLCPPGRPLPLFPQDLDGQFIGAARDEASSEVWMIRYRLRLAADGADLAIGPIPTPGNSREYRLPTHRALHATASLLGYHPSGLDRPLAFAP